MNKEKTMPSRAVIAGVTGLIGSNLAEHLIAKGWDVYGIARKPQSGISGVRTIAADFLDSEGLRSSLADINPTHVFLTSWVRRATEEENIAANGALVRNVLTAFDRSRSLKHVALVTGLKHYLGPFEMYAKVKLDTPLREEMPRLPYPNFFYAQEDALFEAAKRQGFTWSVHRSHTTIGYSIGTSMNMGVTLAVYATICRETGRPFVFPGSIQQWEGLTDVTDVRVLAKHMEWAATSEAGRNQAFNVVNGDIFRWRWLWPRLAVDLGIEAAPYPPKRMPLEQRLAEAGPAWAEIAAKHKLAERDLNKLSSAWHTDADLGREIEVVTDMTKSRLARFHEYQPTLRSFLDLFARLRKERIIP
jgi:nucleoside-diphosphate-sugar epimerase